MEHRRPGISAWAKILIPAGIALSAAVGAGAYNRALVNEHRLTRDESTTESLVVILNGHMLHDAVVEERIIAQGEALARIEGTLGTRPAP